MLTYLTSTLALDTSANLPLLNSLTHLTYLTSTSPRIRELLTLDGGLERLLEILQASALPRAPPDPVGDWWGLRGPSTASIFTPSQMSSLRHSLSFQCVVNIGVRGSEQIRIRLVQSGTLDVIAQILEVWLKGKGMSITSGPLGSQAAVDRASALASTAAAQVRMVVGGGGSGSGSTRSAGGHGKERERERERDKMRDMDVDKDSSSSSRKDKNKESDKGDKMEDIKRWTRDQRARADLTAGGVGAGENGLSLGRAGTDLTPIFSTPGTNSDVSSPRDGRERRSHRDRSAPAANGGAGMSSTTLAVPNAEAGPSRFRVSRDGTIKPSQASPEIMAQVREGLLNADTLTHYVIPEDICTDLDIERDTDRHAITVMHALARIASIAKNQLWKYGIEHSENAETIRQYFQRFGLDIRSLTNIHMEAIERRNRRELPRLAIRPPEWGPSDLEYWQVFDPAEYPPAAQEMTTEEAALTGEGQHRRRERDGEGGGMRDMSVDQQEEQRRPARQGSTGSGSGRGMASGDAGRRRHAISPDRPPQLGLTPGGQTRMIMPEDGPSRRTLAMDIPTPRAPSAPLPADRNTFHLARPEASRGSSAAASIPQQPIIQVMPERDLDSPAPGSVSSSASVLSRAEEDEMSGRRSDLRRTRPSLRQAPDSTGAPTRPRHIDTAASSNVSTPVGTPPIESAIRRSRSGTVTHNHFIGGTPLASRSTTLRADPDTDGERPISRAGTEEEESTDVEPVGNVEGIEAEIGIVGNMDDEAPSNLTALPGQEMMEQQQAEMDLAMGAPPGAPGAIQTPRMTEMTPRVVARQPALPTIRAGRTHHDGGQFEGPGVVIAAGAPRGFSDLGDLVHVMESVTVTGEITYSDDTILLCLQLLAYLSKYPHVRPAFHHLRHPMHPELAIPEAAILPERQALSTTTNLFSLVERFTFRPSPPDPDMQRLPSDIQYWAGVIMRNVYKKVDSCGGIRQCANLSCGRWEKFPKEFAKCRRCRRAKYCSKECQSKAWQEGHRFW